LNWKSFKNKDMEEIPKVILHKIALGAVCALARTVCQRAVLCGIQVAQPGQYRFALDTLNTAASAITVTALR
jgi:hypothetical protein